MALKKRVVMKQLMRIDTLGTLSKLTNSAKLYLELKDHEGCFSELTKIEEYIENLQEVLLILDTFEKDAVEKQKSQ